MYIPSAARQYLSVICAKYVLAFIFNNLSQKTRNSPLVLKWETTSTMEPMTHSC